MTSGPSAAKSGAGRSGACALADAAGTDIYVSQVTGEVVQRTTAASRALNWVGAVPHWLYPTLLRQNAKTWTQVVIWTSLAGTFLTLCGLYLGVLAWGRARASQLSRGRITPFRGLMAWHHLTGLAAGVLTLTWVASGLFSMNPWGFLDSPGDGSREKLAGSPPRLSATWPPPLRRGAGAPAPDGRTAEARDVRRRNPS